MTSVIPADLAGFPGAPFTQDEIDRAVESVQAVVGWHVFPVLSTTVALDVVRGDDTLRLPTRRLVSVESVTDVDRATVYAPTSYRVSRERGRIRKRGGSWPGGFERVEVEFTHGYETCPLDLLGVIGSYAMAARRDPTMQSVRVDDGSVTYFPGTDSVTAYRPGAPNPLARYRLPEWSGMA